MAYYVPLNQAPAIKTPFADYVRWRTEVVPHCAQSLRVCASWFVTLLLCGMTIRMFFH